MEAPVWNNRLACFFDRGWTCHVPLVGKCRRPPVDRLGEAVNFENDISDGGHDVRHRIVVLLEPGTDLFASCHAGTVHLVSIR
jgi:hypothetical protein